MSGRSQRLIVAGLALALAAPPVVAQADPEARILTYIREHLQAGQPVMITHLYNDVFTKPDERKALNKLYNAFFRIPMFIVQYNEKFSQPPTLDIIAQQFALKNREEADTLLRVMESDPRVPKFITRDPKTGEISHVEASQILNDPRFAQGAGRQLTGWEGRTAPTIDLARLDGSHLSSAELAGRIVLLYVWFTGCPPCMKETPELVRLQRGFGPKGFQVVGANADALLGLGYSNEVRQKYIEEQKISFPVVRWTRASDQAYGNISIYPTLFLIDRKGTVRQHWVGYVTPAALEQAVTTVLAEESGKQ